MGLESQEGYEHGKVWEKAKRRREMGHTEKRHKSKKRR